MSVLKRKKEKEMLQIQEERKERKKGRKKSNPNLFYTRSNLKEQGFLLPLGLCWCDSWHRKLDSDWFPLIQSSAESEAASVWAVRPGSAGLSRAGRHKGEATACSCSTPGESSRPGKGDKLLISHQNRLCSSPF